MLDRLESLLARGLARWLDWVHHHAAWVMLTALAISGFAFSYTLGNLGIDSDDAAMLSEDLPFRALRADFHRAFPPLADPLVVVVEGATSGLAQDASVALARRLREEPDRFASVFVPGGGPFFERHGLLYLSVEELEELADHLAEVQPYVAELSRDGSLRGLFSILSDAVDAANLGTREGIDLADVFNPLSESFEATLAGQAHQLSWTELILGGAASPEDRRRFVMVEPVIDYSQFQPAKHAILGVRDIVEELDLNEADGVRVRMTGEFVLSHEELELVSVQARVAGVASFLLVSLILYFAMRSLRMVLASVLTLLAGLVCTAGFAALAIGHLNLISVAFAVLFIGLSVDFGIHFCVRYRELQEAGIDPREALLDTGRLVGTSLVVCAATTAIGFYAFVPTDYAGVAELGLISGTGMLISLVFSLSLLPALLTLGGKSRSEVRVPNSNSANAWQSAATQLRALPVRHSRSVCFGALVLGVGALFLLPDVRFDRNPIRLRDPNSESVKVFQELLTEGSVSPWSVNVLAANREAALGLSERLESLDTVERAVTLDDFVPKDQDAKLSILQDISLFITPPSEHDVRKVPPSADEQLDALTTFAMKLEALVAETENIKLARSAQRLLVATRDFVGQAQQGDAKADVARLEKSVLGTLPERLRLMYSAITAAPVGVQDLPQDLLDRMVATDGRVRVEVFPREDLNNDSALEAFVVSVQNLAPDAIGNGVVMLESERAVVRSLRQALTTAFAVITILLLFLWRRLLDAALVVVPLGLAAVLLGAASVLLDISFNFADVIVIPLLLGMGVDSGIHLVHRYRTAAPKTGNLLQTTTARAVTFSALTTIASFGTLGFSSHPGMASLGQLLTLGIGFTLGCNLILLPALVAGLKR